MAALRLNFDNIVALVRFILTILPDIIAAVQDLADDGQLNNSYQNEE